MTTSVVQTVKGLAIEVGCGSKTRQALADGSLAVGVDLDIDSLRSASGSSTGWSFVGADLLHLPFAEGTCDSAMLRAVLHHVAPVATALDELARVLRTDGLLTIIDGVLLPADEIELLERELMAAGLPGEPCYGFDVREITELVEGADYRVEDLVCEGTTTFATPPFVSRPYTSDRFIMTARRV